VRREKEIVKTFYDTFGWRKRPDGRYEDTAAFVDTRPVLDEYLRHVHLRLKALIPPTGQYFLDAGSGPIAHASSIEYSSGYRRRVCIDLSLVALSEAREKLKEHGLYVIADLTQLPFRDQTFDASMCAHVLYHVPADEQRFVLLELYRTLKPGHLCVVVYNSPTSVFKRLPLLVRRVRRGVSRRLGRPARRAVSVTNSHDVRASSPRPTLYFHAHPYRWFRENLPEQWDTRLRCWRAVGREFTNEFVGDGLFGRLLMRLIYRVETLFPHSLARLGEYPVFLITRKTGIE
jgi:SAM-dependent methyltransferase